MNHLACFKVSGTEAGSAPHYLYVPSISPVTEQQMEVHNRIEPLRGFLFLCMYFFGAESDSFIVTQLRWLTGAAAALSLKPSEMVTAHVDPLGERTIHNQVPL